MVHLKKLDPKKIIIVLILILCFVSLIPGLLIQAGYIRIQFQDIIHKTYSQRESDIIKELSSVDAFRQVQDYIHWTSDGRYN